MRPRRKAARDGDANRTGDLQAGGAHFLEGLRIVGSAYLGYLGFGLLRAYSRTPSAESDSAAPPVRRQFFSQGFFALMLAWQKLERNFNPPPVFDTGNAIVNKANIAAIDKRDKAIQQLAKRYGLKV